eukprot:TRINITY_DN34864_c0_g1_i1.p1 TRINITY_DN34864_c0_g1~~TRINITY_DN34864_c0_g1_i1.p1  ORF type:complete len:325 (+),score=41.27 TRINITY_DN34864_c0_g1_i1:115-1089(+)
MSSPVRLLHLPPRQPLYDLIVAGEKEDKIVQLIRSRRLFEEQRTAAPWSVTNQVHYLEMAKPADGRTALHIAAEKGHARLVEAIIRGGARVDLGDHRGCTALMIAAACGGVEVIVALLRAGSSPVMADRAGRQPLHHAMHDRDWAASAVKVIVGASADMEARDEHGLTPLMLGSATASPGVDALINLGARVLAFDRDGRTPLHHARLTRRRQGRPIPVCVTPLQSSSLVLPEGTASPKNPLHDMPTQNTDVPESIIEAARVSMDVETRTFLAPCPKDYWRWDELGSTDVQKQLLYRERNWRRQGVPLLGVAERDRLHAALPLLC